MLGFEELLIKGQTLFHAIFTLSLITPFVRPSAPTVLEPEAETFV